MTERTRVLLACAGLYVAVFVARLVSDDPLNGITFLYLVPSVVIAVRFGLAGALPGVALSLSLIGVWDLLADPGFGFAAYLVRCLVFLIVVPICGQLAERWRLAAEENARHFELASDMLCVGNLDGTIDVLNGRWEEVLGWSHDELMAQSILAFTHPDDQERTEQGIAAFIASGEPEETFENRMLVKGGGWRHVEWSARVDLKRGKVYSSARDVTERVRTSGARREAEERFRAAFEDSATGMAVVGMGGDHDGLILEVNEGLAAILGVPREELIGTVGVAAFAHPEELPALRRDFERLLCGDIPVLRTELRVVRPDKSERWIHMTTSLLHDEEGRPTYRLSQMLDIDDRKRGEEKLRYLADYDPMSGLANRRRFVSDLERELDAQAVRGSRGAVLAIDLDHFKAVNDTVGHAMGDLVIATVGKALTRRLRSGDVAGRMGGDEFGVLLRRVDSEDAILVAHDLLRAVAYALDAMEDATASRVTLSVGVALIDPDAPRNADDLLARADAAMYEAKHSGGSRVALAGMIPHIGIGA